ARTAELLLVALEDAPVRRERRAVHGERADLEPAAGDRLLPAGALRRVGECFGIPESEVLVIARTGDLDALEAQSPEDVEALLEVELQQRVRHDADLHRSSSLIARISFASPASRRNARLSRAVPSPLKSLRSTRGSGSCSTVARPVKPIRSRLPRSAA